MFFVSCAKGLEYLLADELALLGCSKVTAALAGVNAHGALADASRAVLWSRLASRVLWPLAEFECPDEEALYDGVRAIPWHEHLDASCTIAVDAHLSGEAITHTRYAAQRVKDGIVDDLRERTGARPSVDLAAPMVRVALSLRQQRSASGTERKGVATISLDLGGGSLHRRGWRQAQGAAPLKENVAAAMLVRGGWPALAAAGGALLDPMCGSGTLLIEGAAMAADVAPGLQRFGDRLPTRWFGFDATAWRREVREAKERATAGRARLGRVCFGSDRDPKAIEAARRNVEAAGLDAHVALEVRPVSSLERAPAEQGLVATNPPYAERMAAVIGSAEGGTMERTAALYRELGTTLTEVVPSWRASILCGTTELARATTLRAKKKYQLFNGALECALIVCDPIKSR